MKWYGTTMRWFSALVMVCTLEAAQAARPVVVDELPGLPGQPASYWHAVRGEQEAAQAVSAAARNEAANVFFTGKPYDADLEAYLFQLRTYRPDVARWTTADPSGFPDGANAHTYAPNASTELDPNGLKSVAWVYIWSDGDSPNAGFAENLSWAFGQSSAALNILDAISSSHYIDDGDTFSFHSVSTIQGLSAVNADQIYLAAHGIFNPNHGGYYTGRWSVATQEGDTISSVGMTTDQLKALNSSIQMVNGCNPVDGGINAFQLVLPFIEPTKSFLRE